MSSASLNPVDNDDDNDLDDDLDGLDDAPRTTDIADVEAAFNEAVFRERYAMATLPRKPGMSSSALNQESIKSNEELRAASGMPQATNEDGGGGQGGTATTKEGKKFWQLNCFSTNSSSLYSQYDVTLHSQVPPPLPENHPSLSRSERKRSLERDFGRENHLFYPEHNHHHGHHHDHAPVHLHHEHGHRHRHQPCQHQLEYEREQKKKRSSSHECKENCPKQREHRGGPNGTLKRDKKKGEKDPSAHFHKKAGTFTKNQAQQILRRSHGPAAGGILRHSHSHHVPLPRSSEPGSTNPATAGDASSSFGNRFAANGHFSFQHPLATIGPGNFHTISHYNLYRRPANPFVTQVPCYQPHLHPQEFYHSSVNLIPHAHAHAHAQPQFAQLAPVVDFSKTLGRKRRESPMAMVPVHSLTPGAVPTNPAPPPQAFEVTPINWKKVKSRSRATGGNADSYYKMFTWSPYSNSNPMYYPDAPAFPAYKQPPSNNKNSAAGGGGGKSLEELRF